VCSRYRKETVLLLLLRCWHSTLALMDLIFFPVSVDRLDGEARDDCQLDVFPVNEVFFSPIATSTRTKKVRAGPPDRFF